MISAESVRRAFAARFQAPPDALARAPGRVNLIGEHTDYNEGYVLPIAIDRQLFVAARLRADERVRVCSTAFETPAEWQWPAAEPAEAAEPWAAYVFGVAALLRERGARVAGFDLLIDGDLPAGGGLASSAAVTVGCTLVLADLSGEPLLQPEMIELCREAERRFAGVPCGLMDPFIVLAGQADAALLIDCRSQAVQAVPLPQETCAWLVVDSGVRHRLADGGYAARRSDCQAALAYFQRIAPAIRSLRDVSTDMIRAHAAQMNPLAAARARHVATENARVLAAAEELRQAQAAERTPPARREEGTPPTPGRRLAAFGELLRRSHASLRDEFEVSCEAVDRLAGTLNATPGVYGARLTGGGFGGCVLAAVNRARLAEVEARVRERFRPEGTEELRMWVVQASRGAELIAPEPPFLAH